MSNYNSLKATIDANIKQNGRQEITGQILNSVLNQMVTTLGAGYQFAGVATLDPATDPGTPDAKVFYIANGKGTYTNFGGVEVTEDDVVVLYWDSSWHKVSTGIASQAKLSELDTKVGELLPIITDSLTFVPYEFVVGKKYTLIKMGKSSALVTTRRTESSAIVDDLTIKEDFGYKEFICSGEAHFLRVSSSFNGYLAEGVFSDLKINELKNILNSNEIKEVGNRIGYYSPNLYNQAKSEENKVITSSGIIVDNYDYVLSDFINIGADETITVSGIGGGHIVTFNDSDTFQSRYFVEGDIHTITLKGWESKVRLNIPKVRNSVMLNYGENALPYEPFGFVYSNLFEGVKPAADDYNKKSPNLFDKSTVISGIISTSGEHKENDNYCYTDFIEIDLGSTISIKNGSYIVGYNENKSFGARIYIPSQEYKYTSKFYKYIRIIALVERLNEVSVNIGDEILPFECYGNKGEQIKGNTKSIQDIYKELHPSSEYIHYNRLRTDKSMFSERYEGISVLEEGFNANTKYEDIIAKYDAMMAANPTYITKNKIGVDCSGGDIYEYIFNRVTLANYSTKPTILIDGGTHGFEKNIVFGTYLFLKDLCENYTQNNSLFYLHSCTTIRVIPIVNPTGFDDSIYTNRRGVNINRNYDVDGWIETGQGTSQYTGASPFSEPETQAVKNWITSSDNVLFWISGHTNGGGYVESYGTANAMLTTFVKDSFANKLYEAMNRCIDLESYWFEKEYKNVHLLSNAGHNRFGYVDSLPLDEQERKGLSQQWGMTKAKVLSIVLEGFIGLKDNNSVIFDLYSSDSIKCNAEIMGNAVINILKEFSN